MVNLSQDSIDEFRVRTALESALIQLDASWLILSDLRIDGPGDPAVADYAVIHPRYGIALIDVAQRRRAGKPEQQLRRFLNDRNFTSRFPGALPIVRLVLAPCDAETLERQLREAFAAVPPVAIGDADWVAAIHALLAPSTIANTRPGFPLFRRPGPRRRTASERGAPTPQEEPWNVSPGTPNEPPRAAPPAATEPPEPAAEVAQRQADSVAAPAAAEAGDSNWRAKPRRQAALSDEPTAGQQIQSLIELLRQNGVQRRTPIRTQSDAQAGLGLEPTASPAPDSRAPYDGDVAGLGTPPGSTAQSAPNPGPVAASPAAGTFQARPIGAPAADRSPAATAAAAPPVSSTLAREATAEPREAEDDILSSTTTPHVAAESAAEEKAAVAAMVQPATDVDRLVELDENEENLAAAPTTGVELPTETPTETEYADEAPTPLADAELSAESEDVEDVAFSDAKARGDDAAPLSVSSSIVVPTVESAPETWTPRETTPGTITADETSSAGFGKLRATREKDLAVNTAPPVVESSIVAPAALRNLSARREDAIAPPLVQRIRWRSGATAAILLVALLGGAGAWLHGGSPLPDWLVPTSRSVSIVSALPNSTPTTPPDAAPLPSAGTTTSAPATPAPSPSQSATPVAAPTPAPPAATPPTPAATQPSPAASPVWTTTTTASVAPPKAEIAPPPLPVAKPSEPAKRVAPRRAVPPRALGGNAPVSNRDAAVASLPQEPQAPQGPPIDAGQLPPLAPSATSVASTASAEAAAAAARLHPPTNLTPVRTQASASAPPANATDQACHSYTATRTLLGQPRQVSGLACRDGSGQWQIISELPR
jgi:hypothetical protein